MDQNTQMGSGSVDVKYGGFWLRFWAFMVDAILLQVFLFVLKVITGLSLSSIPANISNISEISSDKIPLIYSLINTMIFWLYSAILESSNKQATVGKMTFGLRVTDNSGNKISFGRATGRYFAKTISGLIFFIGFIMIAFTDKKRGLHDMIAGTLVVKK